MQRDLSSRCVHIGHFFLATGSSKIHIVIELWKFVSREESQIFVFKKSTLARGALVLSTKHKEAEGRWASLRCGQGPPAKLCQRTASGRCNPCRNMVWSFFYQLGHCSYLLPVERRAWWQGLVHWSDPEDESTSCFFSCKCTCIGEWGRERREGLGQLSKNQHALSKAVQRLIQCLFYKNRKSRKSTPTWKAWEWSGICFYRNSWKWLLHRNYGAYRISRTRRL